MGTNLQLLGLGPDDFGGPELEGCNEWLVETRPDLVAQVHRSFFEVGCDVVETDTFGSTSVVLAEYGLADQARELTRTGGRARLRGGATSSRRPSAPAGWPAPWARARSSPPSGTSPTPSSATPTRSRRSASSRVASTSC